MVNISNVYDSDLQITTQIYNEIYNEICTVLITCEATLGKHAVHYHGKFHGQK